MRKFSVLFLYFFASIGVLFSQHSVARKWNDVLLEAIRNDLARPTVHARNLFHVSAAMYDAWAIYDDVAETYLLGKTVGGYTCEFDFSFAVSNSTTAVEEAISFAAYKILSHRFQYSPGKVGSQNRFNNLMTNLGYDTTGKSSSNYKNGEAWALGNYIAECYITFGLQDGSNESTNYVNQHYLDINDPLLPMFAGNPDIEDPNRWQRLSLDFFEDQSGNILPTNSPDFLSPEWGIVSPFSMTNNDLTIYQREGFDYYVYHDPGFPAYIDTTNGGIKTEEYKWNHSLVAKWSSHLDPTDGVMWDISPASIGNIDHDDYPNNYTEFKDFYDEVNGGDPSRGLALNPQTNLPYEPQIVPRGDYTRVLAEFWADGPDSETPPGHWFTILNYVNDHPLLIKKFNGVGEVLTDLEWDIKTYFTLGGAMHDAAIAAWGVKGWYDYIRPISAIRYLTDNGQASDENDLHFDKNGVHLHPGLIELVRAGDNLQGENGENIGKIKLKAWNGPDSIANTTTDVAGVGWILAENWWPYQRPSFVTPPFAGYVSGHSTFSRTAAEVMTLMTGNAFFPGGIGEFEAPQNEFLVFEDGPSVDVTLQWATYVDASEQCSLSRIWGGIHPPIDDIPGRLMGMKIGPEAYQYAYKHFTGDLTTGVEPAKTPFINSLFPNPADNEVTLTFSVYGNKKICLYNLNGQLVNSLTTKNSSVSLDVSTLEAGVYIVKTGYGEIFDIQKLVVY